MKNDRIMLLVEDDMVDAMTVKRAAKDIKITNPIKHVENGEEALEYLKDAGNEKPFLIILDLNMPRMNGIEFLKIIKNDKEFKRIPVIILTTSKEEQDKFESFNLSVAGYMLKPVDYEKFLVTMKAINDYWNISEQPG